MNLISSSLSLFGSLLISIIYLLFKEEKELKNKYYFKFVIFLNMPAIMYFIGILLYHNSYITGEKKEKSLLCTIQGFIVNFTNLS